MSASAAERAWADLNERQRLYLSTILRHDQAAEADVRRASAKWQKSPPASEWRQITYDIKLPREVAGYSSVQSELRRQGQHDSGSGSTLAALERRGLVTVTHDLVFVPLCGLVPRVRVRLSTLGRAAARHGAGAATPATTPAGLMAQWSFNALARLYEAGEDGLELHAKGTPSWNTLLRLRDRRDGSFIEESGRTVRMSAAARRHYELHHACYRELYPEIPAPAPAPVDGAHTGLADHKTRRPRHLVRDTDLRVLAALVRAEQAGTCWLRNIVIGEYKRSLNQEPPPEVLAIPAGLLRREVQDLAYSEKTIDRLTAHPGGPLIEVVAAPRGPFHPETPTIPLIVLTPTGRDHYARHLADYRRAYPDLDLPAAGETGGA